MMEKSRKELSKNVLIGLTGEYFVCAELSSRGVIVVLAPKNNPEIDIIATATDGSRFANIQVKTMSIRNQQGWKLGKSYESRSSQTWGKSEKNQNGKGHIAG